MSEHSYQIDPRPLELGGGWRLRLIENGEEVGGGVFPLAEHMAEADGDLVMALDLAHAAAEQVAREWLDSRPGDDTGPR